MLSVLSARRYSKIGIREWLSIIDNTSWESWEMPTMGRMSSKRSVLRCEEDLLLSGSTDGTLASCCGGGGGREEVEKKVFNEEPSHACLAK